HRYAYVFLVNTAGAREDGLLSEGSSSVDFSWDGVWEAKARQVADGWDLEIAFDARSFQFRPGSDDWGFNVLRYFARDCMDLVWAGRPLSGSIFDLRHEGVLEGMAGIQQGNGLQVKPYLLARSDQTDPGAKRAEAGGEVKYAFTPQLSGTLTV